MLVKVIKSDGRTGFRPIGTIFEVPGKFAEQLIKFGVVQSAVKPKPKKKVKRG